MLRTIKLFTTLGIIIIINMCTCNHLHANNKTSNIFDSIYQQNYQISAIDLEHYVQRLSKLSEKNNMKFSEDSINEHQLIGITFYKTIVEYLSESDYNESIYFEYQLMNFMRCNQMCKYYFNLLFTDYLTIQNPNYSNNIDLCKLTRIVLLVINQEIADQEELIKGLVNLLNQLSIHIDIDNCLTSNSIMDRYIQDIYVQGFPSRQALDDISNFEKSNNEELTDYCLYL